MFSPDIELALLYIEFYIDFLPTCEKNHLFLQNIHSRSIIILFALMSIDNMVDEWENLFFQKHEQALFSIRPFFLLASKQQHPHILIKLYWVLPNLHLYR